MTRLIPHSAACLLMFSNLSAFTLRVVFSCRWKVTGGRLRRLIGRGGLIDSGVGERSTADGRGERERGYELTVGSQPARTSEAA